MPSLTIHGTWPGTWQLAPSSAQALPWAHEPGPPPPPPPAMPISAFAAAAAIPFPDDDSDSDGWS